MPASSPRPSPWNRADSAEGRVGGGEEEGNLKRDGIIFCSHIDDISWEDFVDAEDVRGEEVDPSFSLLFFSSFELSTLS